VDILPLPSTPSWRGAQLKHSDTLLLHPLIRGQGVNKKRYLKYGILLRVYKIGVYSVFHTVTKDIPRLN